MWIHWPFFPKNWTKGHWPLDDLWPMSVEVTCVTLPKDHCVQVPWQYINVCGYSDQFCKIPHTYTYYVHTTYYVQNEWSHSLLLNSVQARQKSEPPSLWREDMGWHKTEIQLWSNHTLWWLPSGRISLTRFLRANWWLALFRAAAVSTKELQIKKYIIQHFQRLYKDFFSTWMVYFQSFNNAGIRNYNPKMNGRR